MWEHRYSMVFHGRPLVNWSNFHDVFALNSQTAKSLNPGGCCINKIWKDSPIKPSNQVSVRCRYCHPILMTGQQAGISDKSLQTECLAESPFQIFLLFKKHELL